MDPTLEQFLDEVEKLSRRFILNMECCERWLGGVCDLTPAQIHVLLVLYESGEITMNQLADAMRLHPTTMTRAVDGIAAKGLAERRADPEDRRIVKVELSAAGRDTVERFLQCKKDFLRAAFGPISAPELAAIVKGMRRLTETLEELGDRCYCR